MGRHHELTVFFLRLEWKFLHDVKHDFINLERLRQ
jgi:hypothetical protein